MTMAMRTVSEGMLVAVPGAMNWLLRLKKSMEFSSVISTYCSGNKSCMLELR